MPVGEVDWEVFAAHLRAEGQEHVLDEYPEYTEYLRSKATPEQAAAEAPPGVIERIVERQVIVIRCKFCQELSPVDLESCKSCGAAKFY